MVKKLTKLTEVEEGDYIFLPEGNNETWNKILTPAAKFPDIAKPFISHAEITRIPKIAGFPYFCYRTLDLSENALFLVVRKQNMEDILKNKSKETLEQDYKRRFKQSRIDRTGFSGYKWFR